MYDLVIVGSGPAGLSAAVYAKRACLDLLVLEKEMMAGGQIVYTEEVDNYLGFPGTSGFDLAQQFEKHARELDVPFKEGEVTGVKKTEDGWQIQLESGESIETKSIILASGAMHRKLGVPGEKELAGAGVSYCATCDGAFFKDKVVAVVGGGDVAIEDALYLAKMCKQVYLVHRRQGLRATQVLQEQMKNTPNITFLPDCEVKSIIGEQKVEKIELNSKAKNAPEELAVDGVFVAIGMEPQAAAYANVLTLEGGYVPAGEGLYDAAAGLVCGRRCADKKAASDCYSGGRWSQCGGVCSRLFNKEKKGGGNMLISSRGQYAIRILLDLAIHENGEAINVKTIAERQELSEKYMEQILSVLQKAGFVISTRGYHGGYHLSGRPENYSVGKILRTVDGPLIPASQQADTSGKPVDMVVNELWGDLQEKIEKTLDGVTLLDLMNSYNDKICFNYMI